MTAKAPPVSMPRCLGKTGFDIGLIVFGAWAIGGSLGEVADSDAMAALHAAAESSETFFDTAHSSFPKSDHRNFSRHGEAFDVGETFAGVPYEPGLAAVEKIRVAARDLPMTGAALRWILMFEQVSTVIPGAKNPAQAIANASVAGLGPLDPGFMAEAREIYREMIAPVVHQRW